MRTYCIVVIMALAACEVPNARKCSTSSDCPSDAFCNSGFCQAVLTVRIEDPAGAGVVHTNGKVDFRIRVEGGYPEKVELLRNGVPFAVLKTPYTFQWDTSGVGEGSCTVTARATIGVNTYSSTPITVVVDRTPPKVTGQSPVAGDLRVLPHSPIYVDFSEPVKLPGSGVESPVVVTGSDGVSRDKDLSLSHGDTRLDIVLPAEPAAPSRLTLTLKTGITDLAGNALELPAAVTWTIPLACSNDSNCISPEKCVGGLCQPVSSDCQQVPCSVSITSPGATTYTNGSVAFEVSLSGAVPDKVELLKNGSPLATLSPPYRYIWDTRSEAEATYQITARATQGATVYESEPRTVVVDRTPPVVVAQEPANGDRNVGIHAPIRVQFSEPVKLPSSGPESAVSLTGPGGSALSSRVSLSSDQRTLQVVPIFDPPVPSEMALALKADITDLAGNGLGMPIAPWVWSIPLWHEPGGDGAFNAAKVVVDTGVSVSIDKQGNPLVAWLEDPWGALYVSRWDGYSWIRLSDGPLNYRFGQRAANPSLALDGNRDVVMTWQEDVEVTDSNAFRWGIFARRRNDRTWESLGASPIDSVLLEDPRLFVDPGGALWLGCYQREWPSRYAVVRKFDGANWPQQGSSLNRYGDRANSPAIAFDSSGAVYAAFTERTSIQYQSGWYVYNLYVSRLAGNWVAIGDALNHAGLSVGGVPVLLSEGPILLWDEGNAPEPQSIYSRILLTGASSWEPPVSFPGAQTDYWSLAIADGGNGTLYAGGWFNQHVKVFRRVVGSQTWEQLGDNLDRTGSSGGRRPVLAADVNGNVVIAWYEWFPELDGSYKYHLRVKRLNR